MSCFVVGEECMAKAVKGIVVAERIGLSAAEMSKLGTELYAMNQAAFHERYEGRHGSDGPAPVFQFGRPFAAPQYGCEPPVAVHVELFKAMQCLSYQCNEGEIAEEFELYGRLEAAVGKLAAQIVSRLPEYEAVKWGE